MNMSCKSNKVELTKVHYYDRNESAKNFEIYTISRGFTTQTHNIIKRNIFGHKWVLKINETADAPKSNKRRLTIYILVTVFILVALVFGIYFTVEHKYLKGNKIAKVTKLRHENITHWPHPSNNSFLKTNQSTKDFEYMVQVENRRSKEQVHNELDKSATVSSTKLCTKCLMNEVCLSIVEGEMPECRQMLDQKDPTGCGGLCKVNNEYCKVLDLNERLFQCRKLHYILNCTNNAFSCGNMCISFKFRCDGIFHCSDKSDEVGCDCDLNKQFQCGNLTGCLERWKRCDGRVDCWDNSDEMNCKLAKCNTKQIACRSGHCIDIDQFCDGVYHCPDKSDEPLGCEIKT